MKNENSKVYEPAVLRNTVQMKILFLDYQHYPAPDATGNCVESLRRQLGVLGVSSDVLAIKKSRKMPAYHTDANGCIYLEPVWAAQRRLRPETGESLWHAALRLPVAITVRIAHRLLSDRYTAHEKMFSWKACTRLRKKLCALCQQNSYDWVVAVAGPYYIHEVAAHAELQQTKLALYYLDPYSTHELFSKENSNARMQQELQTLAKADVVFASLEHESDWRTTRLSQYIDKVHFLPYPNMEPHDTTILKQKDTKKIDLLYMGALHDKVRYPGTMLLLFEKMLAQEPRLRLFVVGYRSGDIVKRQLAEAQQRLGEHLVCLGPVPLPQAVERIRQADCVINLGNYMKNQMPSKLLDYIAEGKPILNISHNKPCNTAPYIERYPWALQFYEQELKSERELQKAAENAVAFVRQHCGKSLAWESVQKAMAGFTAQDVAKQFLFAMR